MGVVYKARQKGLDRYVALKVILTGRLADDLDRFLHGEALETPSFSLQHWVPLKAIGQPWGVGRVTRRGGLPHNFAM
jgi:lipoprotein signal peptidase